MTARVRVLLDFPCYKASHFWVITSCHILCISDIIGSLRNHDVDDNVTLKYIWLVLMMTNWIIVFQARHAFWVQFLTRLPNDYVKCSTSSFEVLTITIAPSGTSFTLFFLFFAFTRKPFVPSKWKDTSVISYNVTSMEYWLTAKFSFEVKFSSQQPSVDS